MSKQLMSIMALGALLSGSIALPAAHAADRDFCQDYARAAVTQFQEARDHRRCHDLIRDDQSKWSGDFQHHFDWCLAVHREEADRQRDERTHALRDCTRDHDHD